MNENACDIFPMMRRIPSSLFTSKPAHKQAWEGEKKPKNKTKQMLFKKFFFFFLKSKVYINYGLVKRLTGREENKKNKQPSSNTLL